MVWALKEAPFGGVLTGAKLNRTMLGWGRGTNLPLGTGRERMQQAGEHQCGKGRAFNLPHLLHLVPLKISELVPADWFSFQPANVKCSESHNKSITCTNLYHVLGCAAWASCHFGFSNSLL